MSIVAHALDTDDALGLKLGKWALLTWATGAAREGPKQESAMAQQMKLTVSVIKADIGSVAGHNQPHPDLLTQAEASWSAAGTLAGRAGVHRAAERARGDPLGRQDRPGGLVLPRILIIRRSRLS